MAATIRMTMKPRTPIKLIRMQQKRLPMMEKAVRDVGIIIKQRARRNVSGPLLQIRSGNLYKNIDYTITRKLMGFLLAVGVDLSDVPYGRIQAKGGWTGRGHKTYIKPTQWLRKSVLQEKKRIRSRFKRFTAQLVKI